MKIAYLISAYKDPVQLGRMLNALSSKDTYFFIHVDAKVDQKPFEDAVPSSTKMQTTFTKNRYWVSWGGWSQVRYQHELLTTSLASGIDFERLFILTAQDYPLWSNESIEKELENNPSRQYIIGLNISELALRGGKRTQQANG